MTKVLRSLRKYSGRNKRRCWNKSWNFVELNDWESQLSHRWGKQKVDDILISFLHYEYCCVLGGFAEFAFTVEPTDVVVVSDRPLTLDCVARFADDTEAHTASIQWLKDSQPFALSPPQKYEQLLE